jgi:hypothetical protein
LSLTVDGKSVLPKLVSVDFPQIELMREGLGEIHIEFTADLPHGSHNRRLILQKNHQKQNAAYLINCLVPRDPDIRIVAQNRNERQSFYQLDYVQAGGSLARPFANGGQTFAARSVHSVSSASSVSACGTSLKVRIIFSSCWFFFCLRRSSRLGRAGPDSRT